MIRRSALVLVFLPLLTVPEAGCVRPGQAALARPEAPEAVRSLDEFEAAYNEFVLLPEGDPARSSFRKTLLAYLFVYFDRADENGDADEAQSALHYAVSLYTPAELRTAESSPGLADRAHILYGHAARRGREDPSLFALALEQRFGSPKRRDAAVRNWEILERWMVRNGPLATEPLLRHEELEQSLEKVAAVFPSPFVTRRLADLYVARYELARSANMQGRALGSVPQRLMEVTGYLILRLYLRADDFDGAIAAIGRVQLDPGIAKLAAVVQDAMQPRRSALPLLSLAEQFTEEGEVIDDGPFLVQSWGIVDNLARRAVRLHPKDAYAHLLRARTLEHAGLTAAAVVHLRRTIELKEDLFEAWQALASLEQDQLADLATRDPETAVAHLASVEQLHAQAVRLWSDRPIAPGLPEAFYTVAEGLYHTGEVDRAEALLRRALSIEPVPNSLDLLGTIALKRSELPVAKAQYESLVNLPFDNEVSALRWEARARLQLGEIALREGDAARSTKHVRASLARTNDLLARPQVSPGDRSERLVERGRLLFMLGELDLAMDDFHTAADLVPESNRAYADPLRYVVAYGYYEQARDLYRRAMNQSALSDNLKLYFSLWLNDLALRQGRTPDPEAQQYVQTLNEDSWVGALAAHARGELEFAALKSRASDRGEQAEAFFYEGSRRWRMGDIEAAKQLMHEVLGTHMMSFFEYDMAAAYLHWNDMPRTARPPLAVVHPTAD